MPNNDNPYCSAYNSAPLNCTKMFLYFSQAVGSHLLSKICTNLLACFCLKKLSKYQSGAFFQTPGSYKQLNDEL